MTQQSHSWAYIQTKIYLKKTHTPCMFIAALFTIAKTWKQHKCPLTDDWIRKVWYIYIMKYYSAIKKNKTMPFAATWIELDTLILSEVCQKEKDKYHISSHIWNLTYGTNEPFHRKETHGLGEQTVVAEGEGMRWTGSLVLVDAN